MIAGRALRGAEDAGKKVTLTCGAGLAARGKGDAWAGQRAERAGRAGLERATRDWAERERGPREAEVRARVSRERREGTAGCCWRSRWPVGEWFTWVKARGGWAAERGLGQVEKKGLGLSERSGPRDWV